MKPLRARLLLLAGGAALAFAIPAAGQREKAPESLLPPGFGETPPPAPKEPPTGNEASPATPAPPPPPASSVPVAPGALPVQDSALEDLEALAEQNLPPPIEVPEASRRPTNPVGPLGPDNRGLGLDAFGNADGRFLSGADGPTQRAPAVALDVDPAPPRPALAGRRAAARSTTSTGSPSAPGCCCAWARPTAPGCWSRRSTSTGSRRACSPSPSRSPSRRPIRPLCARSSAPAGGFRTSRCGRSPTPCARRWRATPPAPAS